MTEQQYFLKPNVKIEPLVNQWYAWANLIPPASAAMYVTNLHLRTMNSYVAAPMVHAAAVKNPAMLGGPFIDYEGKRVDEIKALVEKTMKDCAPLMELAGAIKSLDDLLSREASGFSLEPLYARVPDILKGYVELVYDLNSQPSARFLESLLYRSQFYDPSMQSLSLSTTQEDYRPFVLSTPRLEDEQHMPFTVPFKDGRVDQLAKLKETALPFAAIKDGLGFGDSYDALFKTFLTTAQPDKCERYRDDGVRIRYFGHGCILIETKDVSIITDPAVSYLYDHNIDRYTFSDLPESIDYVLLTHNHQDHVLFETLLQLRFKIGNVIVPRSGGGSLQDPSLRQILTNVGFKNVLEIDEMETIAIEGGSVTGLPFFGEHADLDVRTKIAHLVRVDGKSILCAADSCNVEPKLYDHIHAEVGDVDILFLGMECAGAPLTWLYGPLMNRPLDRRKDQSRRLAGSNFERGIDLVTRMHCKQVYVYAMGQEPWLSYISSLKYTEESVPIVESNKLISECRMRQITAERLFAEKELFLKSI